MLLELDQVVAGYHSAAPILRGACMTISRGQRVAVIGKNASGKSTLLRVAAGLMRPHSGIVRFTGVTAPAFLLQNPREQLICASADEEIDLALRMNGVALEEVDRRKSELMQRFGLETLASRAPFELSGGQQQRLALAALFCREPDLLMLDEPDAFLDGRSRREFRVFVEELPRSVSILWTVCRHSELPTGFQTLELHDGVLH